MDLQLKMKLVAFQDARLYKVTFWPIHIYRVVHLNEAT